MRIQENKFYLIKVKHYGRELEYKGKIRWIKGNLFKIQTESDNKLVFNLKQIFYTKEISEKDINFPEYKPVKIKEIKKGS